MKRIVIIGAGIAGLSTYHALRKYLPPQIYPSLQIVIYESHSSPTATTSLIGGGLGLAPNGFRALNAISPEAVKFIEERGFECKEFVMRNQKGGKLGSMKHWEGGTVGENGERGFGMVMAARGDVHRSLLRESDGENVEDVVQWGRKLKEVREEEDRVELVFEDGEVEVCDLVIGADGAWSKCRDAIFGEDYQPKYE
jgi:2-polyprenyl-6-methoxyphenol hydroxylase-like FAD-dependent oxidoreductase